MMVVVAAVIIREKSYQQKYAKHVTITGYKFTFMLLECHFVIFHPPALTEYRNTPKLTKSTNNQ